MTSADAVAVHGVSGRAFEDLSSRMGSEPWPPTPLERARIRMDHLLATDPGGCWVAEDAGEVVGCSMGLVREGMWGLSLLVVDPGAQSAGIGRELLTLAHEHGRNAGWRVILSSEDPRAMRAYARLGLALEPAVEAAGLSGLPVSADVRPAVATDRELMDAVDREVRGAARGSDIGAMRAGGAALFVVDGEGYAVALEGHVWTVAARQEAAARELLVAALSTAPDGGRAMVHFLTARQRWAIDTCLDAGLELRSGGSAVFIDGAPGPYTPYVPSGMYL